MKLLPKAALAIVAAGALVIGGATFASASSQGGSPRPQAVPKSAIAKTQAHVNAIGTSPRQPARTEAHQVTIAPCTIFDTTKHGGKLLNNHSRTVLTRGVGSMTAQGGPAAGCGVPDTASAVTVVLTASGATAASGHLNWQPTGATKANRVVSYTKNQTTTTSGYLQLATTDPAGKIINAGGAVNLQITVVGYSIAPIQGMISSGGTIYSGSTRILSAAVLGTGSYSVTVDSDVSYCTPTVTAYAGTGVYASASGFSGNTIYVHTWYISNSTHLEVPYSYYFYLSVDC